MTMTAGADVLVYIGEEARVTGDGPALAGSGGAKY